MNVKTKRRLLAAIPALVVASIGFPSSANAALSDYVWSSGCGDGHYGVTAVLQGGSIMDNASRSCGDRAQVHCQNISGAHQWQSDPTYRGLGVQSSKSCGNGYTTNMDLVGVIYLR
jgi:hypothetical protein